MENHEDKKYVDIFINEMRKQKAELLFWTEMGAVELTSRARTRFVLLMQLSKKMGLYETYIDMEMLFPVLPGLKEACYMISEEGA